MSAQPTARDHLGDRLSDYVDRALPEAELWHCDRHVLTCPACRQAAADERRLLESLRRVDDVPVQGDALRQALLQLGAQAPAVPEPAQERLCVLSAGAPAMHRSARLSVALAGAAAAACVVAAWAVTGGHPLPAGGAPNPASQPSEAVVRPAGLSPGTSTWHVAPAAATFVTGDRSATP